jgi:hypothetical protein
MMFSHRALRKFVLRVLLPASFLAVAGCIDLDNVAQLTKLADSAQQTLPAVVADIPASCQRQNLLLNDIPSTDRFGSGSRGGVGHDRRYESNLIGDKERL